MVKRAKSYKAGFVPSDSNLKPDATLQDVLELDSWARLNKPGIGEGNWSWRYKQEALTSHLEKRLYETAKMFGR